MFLTLLLTPVLLLGGCGGKTPGDLDTSDTTPRGATDGDDGGGQGGPGGSPGGAEDSGGAGDGGDGGGDGGTTDPLDDDIDIPELGEPVASPLAGTTWRVAFSSMDITEPPGLGPLIPTLIDEDAVLFNVMWASGDSFGMQVGIGTDGGQDPCDSVQELPAADFSENPLWSIPETSLTISSGSDPVTVQRAEMLGVLSEDGLTWTWATLRGRIDSRDFAEDAEEGGIDICGFLESLGGECVECDDGEPMCITLVIDSMVGEQYTGVFDPDAGDDC